MCLPGGSGVQCHHTVWGWVRKKPRSYSSRPTVHSRAMPAPEKNPIHVHPEISAPSALPVLPFPLMPPTEKKKKGDKKYNQQSSGGTEKTLKRPN